MLSSEIFAQAVIKDFVVGGDVRKQGHRGLKFHGIRVAKNIFDCAPVEGSHDSAALPQSWAEDRMVEVRLRFFTRGDRKLDRHVAVAQALDLRKNKPHPVTSLSTIAQFAADVFKDGLLGIHEALQMVWIVHVSSESSIINHQLFCIRVRQSGL